MFKDNIYEELEEVESFHYKEYFGNNAKQYFYENSKEKDENYIDVDLDEKNHIDLFIKEWIEVEKYNNFHKTTKESYFRKILSNSWDFIVDWSINLEGNQHFAVTINMPCDEDDFYEGMDLKSYLNLESSLINHIFNGFKTITFLFIVSEKNKKGILHFHILIAIKNIIDYNYVLKNNLLLWLKRFNWTGIYMNDFDIKIDSLFFFKDIKNWAIYMYKNMYCWKFTSKIFILPKHFQNIWIKNLGDVTFFYLKINFDFININNKNILYYENFHGIKITNNRLDQRVLINLLQYYLILNDYYIYNDNIYKKIEQSKISYKLVGSLNEILFLNFKENIIIYYNINFENYFKGLDFNYLMDTYFIKNKNIIENIKEISSQIIKPSFGLIEFIDGVYCIKYDRFIKKENFINFSNKVSTLKYYNKSYQRTRKDKPINWINGLKNALNIQNNEFLNESYVRLCLNMINPLHKNIFNKKSTLFVYGKSNTGKTTLLVNPLNDYYGKNNIGSIISTKNFKWQDLINKMVGIIDEGRYNSTMSSDLLKITGQENIIVEKKYSKEHINIESTPIIILTNLLFEDKDKSIDIALKNRLYIIEFINIISEKNLKNSNNFKSILKSEEANIIIYCNKLLFKLKEGNLKKIGKKISNKKIIKLL